MIDTDKIMRTTKILLHRRHINKNEADDYLELIAEVKRLREAIADVANNMEAADPSLLRSFIKDLLEVIE